MNSEQDLLSDNRYPNKPIRKAQGVTSEEKYLARLCEKTFLSLWSYPGAYRDQGKIGSTGDGKEICDLLVVFGQHVIIFSDKLCRFQNSGDEKLDWQRWFRKAVQKSAEQAWGAERWIRNNPNRIFIDRACKQRLPINMPAADEANFHLVVVAHGVSSRIKQRFANSSGSLIIDSGLKNFENHVVPFNVGDLNPKKTFIHILDDDSLNTLMTARDTISDFVSYLSKREKLFRASREIFATGEEELLAIYLKNFTNENEHDFIFDIKPGQATARIFVQEGHWTDFEQSPERLTQLNEDYISYSWDKLIETFIYYAIRHEQQFVTAGGIKDVEKILRFMAREPRWKRRYFAKHILEIIRTTPISQRRLTVLLPTDKGDPYYVFLLLPTMHAKTREEYRTVRRNLLIDCCRITKLEFPDALDVVGIATETGQSQTSRSEDAVYFDARVWNDEIANDAKTVQRELRILIKPRMRHETMTEYPNPNKIGKLSKNPRNKPCPCGSLIKYKNCCLNKVV